MSKKPFTSPQPFYYRREKSQAAVEFALAFPILLLIIFGIMDFSLLFAGWLAVENVARQAAHYAATGQYQTTYCPAAGVAFTGPDGTSYTPTDSTCTASDSATKNAEVDAARIKSIKNYVDTNFHTLIFSDSAATELSKGYYHVTVCSTTDTDNPPDKIANFALHYPVMGGMTTGDYARCYRANTTTQTENAGSPYYDAIIMVDYDHTYLTPFISNFGAGYFHLASTRSAVVEPFRVARLVPVSISPLVVTNTPGGPTLTPVKTFTPTIAFTKTLTPTKTLTFTPTLTPTKTLTFTPTLTPTNTATPTITPIFTATVTPTPTKTLTPTQTWTPSQTFTPSMTPTKTLTPTKTATVNVSNCTITGGITTTDLFFHQNVSEYGCMYNCQSSPYLQQANSFFLAGTYYWKVETVGGATVQINNGEFFLPTNSTYIGPRANPQPGDIIIPLGLNMYNTGGISQDQVVKVSLWYGTAASACGGIKTDNFKVLDAFPSPTPTATDSPVPPTGTRTLTPTPTWTPTPTLTPTSTKTFTPTITLTPLPTATRTRTNTPLPVCFDC